MKKAIWKSIISAIITGALMLSPMSILANEEGMESVSEKEFLFETEQYEDVYFDMELTELSAQDAEYMTEGEDEITEDVIDDFTDEAIDEMEDGMLEEDVLEAADEASILIDVAHFPDANFRSYVSEEFDTDHDGYLSSEERDSVVEILVEESEISNLSGVELFTKLETLDCDYNQLTSLNISNNLVLEHLECGYNQLTSLDISNNPELYYIRCCENQLGSLDVSNNLALEELECDYNQLTSLDISNNLALEDVWCDYNQLTSLNVSNNTALKILDCSDNQLTSLDVSNNTKLVDLMCRYNPIPSLNVSNNTALNQLSCEDCQLTTLDISNNTALEGLNCEGNQLTSLDVSKQAALKWLICYDNQIGSLDISNCPKVEDAFYNGERTYESYWVEYSIIYTSSLMYDSRTTLITSTETIPGYELYNQGEETYSFKNFGDSDSKDGHCFGMSMTSSGYHLQLLDKGIIGGNSATPLYSFTLSDVVKKPICKYQAIQGDYSKQAIVAGGSLSLRKVYDIASDWQSIINYVKSGDYDHQGIFVIGYWKKDVGGHAVNFLDYENVDGQDRIYIVDSNNPWSGTYFYQDSSGQVFQKSPSTFDGAIDCMALWDARLYYPAAASYDATHAVYMAKNDASVQGLSYSYMATDSLPMEEYVMYEIPADQEEITIIPKKDNASFVYMGTEYSFGKVTDETYATLELSTVNDENENSNESIKIYNEPVTNGSTAKKTKVTTPAEKITISKKPTIQKPAPAKGKITVKWKHFKQNKKTKALWKKIKRVQIQCATDKGFKNIVKTTTVGKKKKKATIKGLAKKTTYYVRVRYYDGTGYSAWSKVKKVKTK